MAEQKIKIYCWDSLNWDIRTDGDSEWAVAMCPKQKCSCELREVPSSFKASAYEYECIRCDFKIRLNKTIEDKSWDFLRVQESLKFKDAEIVNIDGDLIRIQRAEEKDNDYWIDAKISRNKKGELQLMVLAGSKKSGEKTQLFLDNTRQRMSFDQNDSHPRAIFTSVIGTFKDSITEIRTEG